MIPVRPAHTTTLASGTCAGDRQVCWDAATQHWLVLEEMAVSGMPTFTVVARLLSEAAAEHEAGYHAAKTVGWLLYDRSLGYRLAGSRGWTAELRPRSVHTEEQARSVAAREPSWQLRVQRADGRITHPDLVPATADHP